MLAAFFHPFVHPFKPLYLIPPTLFIPFFVLKTIFIGKKL